MCCSIFAQIKRFVFRPLLLLTLAIASTTAAIATPLPPSKVSATLYSNTAAELFWTPSDGQAVRIRRNGELLGVFDTRSLFQSGLNPSKSYRYELETVDEIGDLSSSWQLDIAPGGFSSSANTINAYAVGSAAAIVAAPPAVLASSASALLYSNTAAELFWTPLDGHLVRVLRNGEVLGVFDARSLYQSGLDPAKSYRYELQSINSTNEVTQSWQLDIEPGSFSMSGESINAQQTSTVAATVVTNAPPPPAEDPALISEPEPQTPEPEAVVEVVQSAPAAGCQVSSLKDLSSCIDSNQRTVSVLNDLICAGGSCCPGGKALLNLEGKQGITIDGNGHRLLRSSDQRSCSLVDIDSASNVALRNWHLDDDANVAGCQVADKCPRMLHIRHSSNIELQNLHVKNGKGYTIYVQDVDGFTFSKSSLSNSGVLGLYIGHGSNSPSTGVVVEHSTFTDNQTNGLALLGVTGSAPGDNRVANNVFIRNHRLGQWQVAAQYGTGFTGGGQVYIAQASYVDFDNNQIIDGYCENCYVQRRARSGVSGLELGLPGKASVSHVRIRNNRISNHDGFGISHNANSTLTGNVRLENNELINNMVGDHTSGTAKTGMVVSDTEFFESFENTASVNTSAICSNGAIAQQQCGVASRFGSCVVHLSMAGNDCDGSAASAEGDWQSVGEYRQVFLNGWVSALDAGQPKGEWCVDFANSNRDVINSHCNALNEVSLSAVQAFVGTPSLTAISPQNTRYVRYRVTLRDAWSAIAIDDIKLSMD